MLDYKNIPENLEYLVYINNCSSYIMHTKSSAEGNKNYAA